MLFQSVVSFSNIFSFHCCFFVCACFKKYPVILSFTLGQGNVSDTMLRMIDILKDCNHVEMSFIHMVKVLLKSLLFPSLIFLLSPYSTPFLEILQHMWAFGRRKLQWLIKRIVCLLWGAPWGPSGCTRRPLILGNLFLPDVLPTTTFLRCPSSLCCIRINTQDPWLWNTVFLNGVWQEVDMWLSHWILLALGTTMEKG